MFQSTAPRHHEGSAARWSVGDTLIDVVDAESGGCVPASELGDAQAGGILRANGVVSFDGVVATGSRTGEADVEPLDEAANGVLHAG